MSEAVAHGLDPHKSRIERDRHTVWCLCGEKFTVFFDPDKRSIGVGKAYEEATAHIWASRPLVNGRVVPQDEVISLIGEGVHVGLRKGTDAADAHDLWKAISDSKTDAWSDAVGFLAYTLEQAGYALVKKEA